MGINVIRGSLRLSSLVPGGLVAGEVAIEGNMLVVTAHGAAVNGQCPSCHQDSSRQHSRYFRVLSDLPASGRGVRIRLVVRRFRCGTETCSTRIFAERFGNEVLPVRSRRTARLECLVHHLGLALGGRPAASFAKRLMLPVSNDTLLRVLRRQARPRTEPLTAVGIDDWAFRRNHRYGTIICDLERRRIVTLSRSQDGPLSGRLVAVFFRPWSAE